MADVELGKISFRVNTDEQKEAQKKAKIFPNLQIKDVETDIEPINLNESRDTSQDK